MEKAMYGIKVRNSWLAAALVGFALCVSFYTARAEQGQDHPLIERYPGSEIRKYVQKEFYETELPAGKAGKQAFVKTLSVGGKVTAIDYKFPKGRSTLEVYENYADALREGGFETLFSCAGDDCGKGGPTDALLNYRWGCFEQRHFTGKLLRSEGDVFVNLHVCKGVDRAYLTIVESKPMDRGLVKVDADALADEIERTGHASVYGIYFDSGQADVKPESDQALGEIARLLGQRGDLKLYVVGHTDSTGALDFNMSLSERRAKAVVDVLSKTHGVAASRLRGEGVGPLAPVAANGTEEGRARNRRVELVAQ